jgi:hypothetical protein
MNRNYRFVCKGPACSCTEAGTVMGTRERKRRNLSGTKVFNQPTCILSTTTRVLRAAEAEAEGERQVARCESRTLRRVAV